MPFYPGRRKEGKGKDLFMFSGLGWNKLGVNLKENYATSLEGLLT